jgi:hypothetical protein
MLATFFVAFSHLLPPPSKTSSKRPRSLARLTVILTPEKACWVSLPPPLIGRLLDGGAPMPLALDVSIVAADGKGAAASSSAAAFAPLPPQQQRFCVAWGGGATPGGAAPFLGVPAALAALLNIREGATVDVRPLLLRSSDDGGASSSSASSPSPPPAPPRPPPEGHPRLRVPGLGRRLGGHPGAGGAPRGINHQPSRRRQRRRAVSRLCPARRRRGRARIARGDRDRALGVSRGVSGARVRVRRRARGPEGGKREREGRRQQQQRQRRRRSSRCRRRRLLAAGAPLGGGAGRVPLRGALCPPASTASAAACRDRVDAGRQAPRDRPLDHGLGPCLGRGEAFVAAAIVAFVADAVGVVSLLSSRRRRCQLRSRQQLTEALPRSEGFFRRC